MLSEKDQPRSRMGFPWFRYGLPRSTRKGFATRACDLFGFAFEVTAAVPEHVGRLSSGGWSPLQDGSLSMSHNLTLAQNHAFDLARTLMVPVILFQTDSEFGVMVSSEYDGDQDAIVHEYDPWCPAH